MTEYRAVEENEFLKLSEFELANLHLSPVTSVTLYEGPAPIGFLRNRIALMLEKNPWLTSRLVKKDPADGVMALAYSKALDAESVVDQHLSVYEPGDVGYSLAMPYEELVQCLLPVRCAGSKQATDKDEVLFKVAVVPIEEGAPPNDRSTPLQPAVTLPGFALVVSMNHTLGDGHTYYKLYGMLSADAEVDELDRVHVPDYESAKTGVIGEKEAMLFKRSPGLGLGILGSRIARKLGRRAPQNVCINEVDPAWVDREKAEAKQEGRVSFVSTNDALTSWYFREMRSDVNIMIVNCRNRRPSILNLADHHAGNYEAVVPYFPGDLETPALIRQSISEADGAFRAKRAGSPKTEAPGFRTLLRNRVATITNWTTFHKDVYLRNNGEDNTESTIKPKLHLPIVEPDGIITSVWNVAVIFRPRSGETGMLMITRHLNSTMLAQKKELGGPDVPLGKSIL